MKKTTLLILVIIIALSGFLIYQNSYENNSHSSEEQLSALIQDGKDAVENKDFRRTMSYISKNFTSSNSSSYESLRNTIISAYRATDRYSVAIDKADIAVDENQAEVKLHVKIFSTSGQMNNQIFDGPITLHFINEPTRRWLVFPTRQWKVNGTSDLSPVTYE